MKNFKVLAIVEPPSLQETVTVINLVLSSAEPPEATISLVLLSRLTFEATIVLVKIPTVSEEFRATTLLQALSRAILVFSAPSSS